MISGIIVAVIDDIDPDNLLIYVQGVAEDKGKFLGMRVRRPAGARIEKGHKCWWQADEFRWFKADYEHCKTKKIGLNWDLTNFYNWEIGGAGNPEIDLAKKGIFINRANDENLSADIVEFCRIFRETVPDAEDIFMKGRCIEFAMLLEHNFPGGEVVYNEDHAGYRINQQVYDVMGVSDMTGGVSVRSMPLHRIAQILNRHGHPPNTEVDLAGELFEFGLFVTDSKRLAADMEIMSVKVKNYVRSRGLT